MSLEDRLREELHTEGIRVVPGSGDVTSVMRRGRRRRAAERTGLGIAVALAVVGPLTLLPGRDTAPGPLADPTTLATTPTTEAPEPTTPPSGPIPTWAPPGMIVSGVEGISRLEQLRVVESLEVGPVMLALDDLGGGYVVQVGVSASSIMRIPAADAVMTELIIPQANEVLRLHETTVIDGSPAVVHTRRIDGTDPESSREELALYFLDTGDTRLIAQVGGFESGPGRVSYGGGRFLLSMHAEGTTWFEFLSADGSEIEVPANPRREAATGDGSSVWVGHGDQSSDGRTMAFLRGIPHGDVPFALVVVDLEAGTETAAVPVEGAGHDNVTRIDWDGQIAVVSFTDRPALLVSPDGTVTSLDVDGTVAITP